MQQREPMRSTLFSPFSSEWWSRGPASIDGDYVYLDSTRATPYPLVAEQLAGVGLELARVRDEADVVRFVENYGLLALKPSRDAIAPPVRERVDFVLARAAWLRDLVEVVHDARAFQDGDESAGLRLQEFLLACWENSVTNGTMTREQQQHFYEGTVRVPRLLSSVSTMVVGMALVKDLETAPLAIYDGSFAGAKPGHLKIGISPTNLDQVCALTIAMALGESKMLSLCPRCAGPFQQEDARQKYCNKVCADRARAQRYLPKLQAKRAAAKRQGRIE